MADADKQKEMDAKKAEVFFFIAIMILNAIMVMIINAIKTVIINAIMVRILDVITIVRCEQGWRLRLQGRRTRRVS